MRILMLLLLLVSCGSKGGRSGSSEPAPTNTNNSVQVYEYRLRAQGAAGVVFVSNSIANFGAVNESQLPYGATLDGNDVEIAIFGETAFWEVQKTGGGDLTIILTRDGVEVARDVLTVNGQVVTLTDNI